MPTSTDQIEITAVYGGASSSPQVSLTVPKDGVTMTPDEAREVGMQLIEAATAAEMDELALFVATRKMALSLRQGQDFLAMLREARDAKWASTE